MSHDGNRVWKLIAPPNDVTGLGPVSCPDSRHCLALATTANNSGEVLSSSDGALHWQIASRLGSPGFPALYCRSANWCIRAIGGYGENGPIPELTAISHDQGKSFSSMSTLLGAESISSITCATSLRCVAAGSTFTQGSPGPGEGAAYASTDGGKSWARVALPRSISSIAEVACPTAMRCVAAATAFASSAPSSNYGVLLSSGDSGMHWSVTISGKRVPAATVACSAKGHCVAGGESLVATN